MVPFAALLAALEEVPDPRRPQGRRYAMSHLLLFAVLAVLAGATSSVSAFWRRKLTSNWASRSKSLMLRSTFAIRSSM